MDKNYGGIIWTNHALARLKERAINQGDAWATWRNPQQSRKGASGNWVYYRTYGDERIEVVATQNQKKEWVVLSVWSKTVHIDPKNKGSKESFWITLLKRIFFNQ